MAKNRPKASPIEVLDDDGAGVKATSRSELEDQLHNLYQHAIRHSELPTVVFRNSDGRIYRAIPSAITVEFEAADDWWGPSVEVPVSSSAIARAKYYPAVGQLVVEFPSAAVHSYAGVPQKVVAALQKSKSAGQYFNTHIKGVYAASETEWDAEGRES